MKNGSSMALDPSHFSIIETLRNGRRVEIRAQRPQDREDLEAAIARMSDESLYRRFFGARRHFSEKEAEYFLNINFVNQVALVVVAEENGKQSIVGAGRYVVIQPGRAEVAFAVVDEYQGQGAGAALMRNLAAIARQAGLNELMAEVLGTNGAMLKVFERSGLRMSTRREGPVVHVMLGYA
jgi:RimJ/RimL family protein N-acetyltransferase